MAANLRRDDKKKRTRERKDKKFADYDWKGLIEERKVDSLFVYEHTTSTSKDIISHLKRELRLIRFSQ